MKTVLRFTFILLFSVFVSATLFSGETEIVAAVQASFGTIERDSEGKIIAVDLANERASADDNTLKQVLKLPNLKSLRAAGGTITSEAFAGLREQTELENLFLKDLTVNDADLARALTSLTKLKRLTLRRLQNVTELPALPSLRNLALIEISFTEKTLRSVLAMKQLAALDLRNCSGLTAENYKTLTAFKNLVDLKIGGFAVNDDVLKAITPLPKLTGLSVDDSFITAEGFARYADETPSSATLKTLVLNKGTLLDDDLMPLKKLPKLDRLTLNDMILTGTFLARLAEDKDNRPKLKTLSLRKTLLTAEGAAGLKNYPEIMSLDLSGTGIDAEIAQSVVSLPALKTLNVQLCQLDEDVLKILQAKPGLKIVR